MTCGENLDAHKKHWAGFNTRRLKQLISDPQYKDNMNGAISILLKRTSPRSLRFIRFHSSGFQMLFKKAMSAARLFRHRALETCPAPSNVIISTSTRSL